MIQNDSNPVNSNEMILFLWAKRKFIALICFMVAIISTVYSFFLTPLFLSTAIVYPAQTSAVSISEQSIKQSTVDFGEEEKTEQLIQLLQSKKLQKILVERFDLEKHYGISPESPTKNYELDQAYRGNIEFNKTKLGAIEIAVLDKDRFLAAKLANKIVDLIDTLKNEIIRERTLPAFKIVERERDSILVRLGNCNIIMDSFTKLGVISSESRANLFEAYNDAKSPVDKVYFRNKVEVNLSLGDFFDNIAMNRNNLIDKLSDISDIYDQAYADLRSDFNHKFVIQRAMVTDKKEKPKKIVIILVTTLITFIMLIFGLIIQEKLKKIQINN